MLNTHPLLASSRPRSSSRSSAYNNDLSSSFKSSLSIPRQSLPLASSLNDSLSCKLSSSINSNRGYLSRVTAPDTINGIPKRKCTVCKKQVTTTRMCSTCMMDISFYPATNLKTPHRLTGTPITEVAVPTHADFSETRGTFKDSLPYTSVIVLGTNMKVARITHPILHKLGLSSTEIEGEHLSVYVSDSDEPKFKALVQKVLQYSKIKESRFPASKDRLKDIKTQKLLKPMEGAKAFSEKINFCHGKSGDDQLCELTLWLGGSFGAKRNTPATHQFAIMIGTISYINAPKTQAYDPLSPFALPPSTLKRTRRSSLLDMPLGSYGGYSNDFGLGSSFRNSSLLGSSYRDPTSLLAGSPRRHRASSLLGGSPSLLAPSFGGSLLGGAPFLSTYTPGSSLSSSYSPLFMTMKSKRKPLLEAPLPRRNSLSSPLDTAPYTPSYIPSKPVDIVPRRSAELYPLGRLGSGHPSGLGYEEAFRMRGYLNPGVRSSAYK